MSTRFQSLCIHLLDVGSYDVVIVIMYIINIFSDSELTTSIEDWSDVLVGLK